MRPRPSRARTCSAWGAALPLRPSSPLGVWERAREGAGPRFLLTATPGARTVRIEHVGRTYEVFCPGNEAGTPTVVSSN